MTSPFRLAALLLPFALPLSVVAASLDLRIDGPSQVGAYEKIEFGIAFVCKVTPDGLIAEDRTYFDSAVMMTQLGLAD